GLHLDIEMRVLRRVAHLDRAGELRELPPNLRQHVSCHEPDDRVGQVELVRAHGRDRHTVVLPALDRGLRHLLAAHGRRSFFRGSSPCMLALAHTLRPSRCKCKYFPTRTPPRSSTG